MPLQSSGAINFTDIQAEYGNVAPISLSEYYALASGLPSSGPISMSNFYGTRFLVYEIITSNLTWSPKVNLSRFIHIYVIGAGGSGGHGWADNQGLTTGVAGGSGGGGGGTAYSVISASSAGASTVIIGGGGAGVVTSFANAANGNGGGYSLFSGSGLYMVGYGGGAGLADTSTSSGGDRSALPGGAGGGATGGNALNLAGGSGGSYDVSASGVARAASGGGAPRFLSANDGNGAFAGTNVQSSGGKASGYGNYPAILNTYPTGRGQAAIINSSVGSFDATDGSIGGGTGWATYGAGSGGCAHTGASGTGRGGNGIVLIIYEV